MTKNLLKTVNAELNPICHLLILLGAHHVLYISKIRVKLAKHHKPVLDGLVNSF